MGKQKRKIREAKASRQKRPEKKIKKYFNGSTVRTGRAKPPENLFNNFVHIFVDDQNLFYGIVNEGGDYSFRIDFGKLLLEVCKDSKGNTRGIKSAYIAGVIPDDDSFWKIAETQGFTVRRGYLGSSRRSKQDDAFLIADLVETIHVQEGPSTIILVAGDADYVPPLIKSKDKGWRNEVAFINRGASASLEMVVHEFRIISPYNFKFLDNE